MMSLWNTKIKVKADQEEVNDSIDIIIKVSVYWMFRDCDVSTISGYKKLDILRALETEKNVDPWSYYIGIMRLNSSWFETIHVFLLEL